MARKRDPKKEWRAFGDAVKKATAKGGSKVDFDSIDEANESSPSKETALANLREQVAKGETMGVVDMYERAAYMAGASQAEVREALKH